VVLIWGGCDAHFRSVSCAVAEYKQSSTIYEACGVRRAGFCLIATPL
jgi:hypothetical protein